MFRVENFQELLGPGIAEGLKGLGGAKHTNLETARLAQQPALMRLSGFRFEALKHLGTSTQNLGQVQPVQFLDAI